MESENTVFYLGKKEESAGDNADAGTGKKYRTALSGDLPFALETYNDKWHSESNLERVEELSKKCERRSMVVRRMIYLERRQTEIISAMMGHGKRFYKAKLPFVISGPLLITAPVLIPFLVWSATFTLVIPIIAIIIFITIIITCSTIDKRVHERKEEELSWKLKGIEIEHEELETEKAELDIEISKLRKIDEDSRVKKNERNQE